MSVFNNEEYIEWRRVRLQMITNLFGNEYFANKKVLELGCGNGHIGNWFEEKGAIVTFAEGRPENIAAINKTNPESKVVHLNQEFKWYLGEKFDVIIHWGVLYHLDNWRQDLISVCKQTDLLFLETEVTDSSDPNIEAKIGESRAAQDQTLAMSGLGTRPSPLAIENVLHECGMVFVRYDDPSINTGQRCYDWDELNDGNWQRNGKTLRRFWIVRRK